MAPPERLPSTTQLSPGLWLLPQPLPSFRALVSCLWTGTRESEGRGNSTLLSRCKLPWRPNQTGAEQAWVRAGPLPEAAGTSVLTRTDLVSWVGMAQGRAGLCEQPPTL